MIHRQFRPIDKSVRATVRLSEKQVGNNKGEVVTVFQQVYECQTCGWKRGYGYLERR